MADLAGGAIAMDIRSVFDRAGFNTVISDMTKQFSKAGDDMGKLFGSKAGASASNSMSSMRMAIEQQMRAAQSGVESAMQSMVKATNNQSNAVASLEISQKRVNEVIKKHGEDSSQAAKAVLAHTKAQQGLSQAGWDVEKATRAQTEATTALADVTARSKKIHEEASSSTAAFGAAMNTAGLAITGGFVAAVGYSIDKAADFETSQNRLVTSAGMAAGSLKQVSDGILQMAGQVGVSAQELSTAMYTVSSGMVRTGDASKDAAGSLDILKAAAQGAKMEGAETKTVADAITTALHDYHLSADQAANVTSKMVTAVSMGKTTLEEFAGSLHTVQPLAGSLGVSIDSLYGTLAAMTASGESADQATQHMEHALTKLQAATSPMTNELSAFGIQSADIAANLSQRGLAGTLEYISDTIKNKFGPAQTLEIDQFNKSQVAAQKAKEAHDHLAPSVQALADQVNAGTLGTREFVKATSEMGVANATQAQQWLSLQKNASGFSAAVKGGSTPAIQSYQQAMQLATGDMSTMDVALMVTGENAEQTNTAIKTISDASADAGGNVKGWDEIQGTFNQRMAEFKDSLGASAISLGNDFLPAATSVAKILSEVGTWLSQNRGFLDDLTIAVGIAAGAFVTFKTVSAMWSVMNIGIEAASAAMGLFTVAEEGATVGAGGLAAALAATGISEIVIGVTALVAAIIGLAVGVKYAYDHWGWFHNAVQSTWDALKAFGSWIASTSVTVWHALEHAWDNVVHAWGNFTHAMDNVGHAVMNVVRFVQGAMHVLEVVGAVVMTVIAVPFVLAFKVIEAAVKWLYENVFQPTWNDLEIIWHWLYDNVIKPVIASIKKEIDDWGKIIHWIHDDVIDPVFHSVGAVWHWLYDNVIKPVVGMIKKEISDWGVAFHWLHDNVIKPVGDGIHTVMEGMKTAFKDVVDWLDTQWSRIEGIVGPPVKFIVDTVYNEGIVPTWNAIAGVFGLGTLSTVGGGLGSGGSTPPSGGGSDTDFGGAVPHAGGGVWSGPGVLPGYSPGKDSVNAVLSPGEGVAVPELVQAIGPQRFMQLNWAYSNGRKPGSGPGFDAGGIFGGVVNAGKDIVGGAMDTAKFVAKLATDPEGAVKQLFSGVLGQADNTPGNPSNWLTAIKSLPGKVVAAVIDKATSWRSGAGGTPFTGSPDLMGWIAAAEQIAGVGPGWTAGLETLIGRESGGNPNAINNWDSNAAAGDPSRGLMQTIGGTFSTYRNSSLPNNIYDPIANIVAGINYIKSRYGVGDDGSDLAAKVQQADASRSPRGYAGGGIVDGKTPKRQPQQPDMTAINRAQGWLQTVLGRAYNEGGLDCSMLMSGVYQSLVGGDPGRRAFTTISDFAALGFRRGQGGVFDIGVLAKPGDAGHMAGELNGHRIESSADHGVVMDGPARGAGDPMFPDHWYLPGSAFKPAYTGTGATPSQGQQHANRLSAAAQKFQKQADRYEKEAQAADQAATKHEQNAAKYRDEAAKAKTAKAKKNYEDDAARADAAAQKSHDKAADYRQKAQDATAKADQAEQDANAQDRSGNGKGKGKGNAQNSTTSGILTFHQLGEKLGGIGADFITETFGLDRLGSTITNSRILKVGDALANAKFGAPYMDQFWAIPGKQQQEDQNSSSSVTGNTAGESPSTSSDTDTDTGTSDLDQQPDQVSTSDVDSDFDGSDLDQQPDQITAGVYDAGGWLEPGQLAVNLGRRPEPILAPQQMDQLRQLATAGVGGGTPRAWVNIEHITHVGGDEHTTAKRIVREMNTYQTRGAR